MKPSSPGDSSPSPPSHKLELQTLKLEELTVSLVCGVPGLDTDLVNPWPLVKARTTTRRLRFSGTTDPLRAPAQASAPAPAPAPVPAPTPFPASSPATLTLEEELQEAIHRAQLLPNRNIDDILEDHVEPDDLLPPISLDFPGSFDVLSPSPDSEGFSSVFSSSLPSPTSSLSPSPRALTDSLDWLETLSGGPPLGSGPPGPSIFSADVSDSTSTGLWELLPDAW
ncbi:MEF2-activating motif and SAP domain-containing transcriptional regulator [Cricetulus griseus]|uniref:MEF2-activating motif and SAP domain-containing transcriptional regulator n=1 Tax=Cricetulus griseus TaxID=10029 RepID=G3HZX0_CRIGR|nr:MEF2-activating motif and SAP domain-containing transcriptional regulator [Cricetulus griseus]